MSNMDPIAAARAMIEPLTGYTPGPWYAGQPEDAHGWWIVSTDPEHYENLDASGDGGFYEPEARLIAAAPDLRDMVATLTDALKAERAESERLRGIIDKMDQHSPRADRTCAEPGITLSEAVMRAWPELAEPKDEVSA